jgi:hypothetical protein
MVALYLFRQAKPHVDLSLVIFYFSIGFNGYTVTLTFIVEKAVRIRRLQGRFLPSVTVKIIESDISQTLKCVLPQKFSHTCVESVLFIRVEL